MLIKYCTFILICARISEIETEKRVNKSRDKEERTERQIDRKRELPSFPCLAARYIIVNPSFIGYSTPGGAKIIPAGHGRFAVHSALLSSIARVRP